jgi:DivIVA domain-containing protein
MTSPDTTTDRAAAFPAAPRREKGYDPKAVDSFLLRARSSFESRDGAVTAGDIRGVAFPLVRHGYAVGAVDTALGRIEDAFASREREEALAAGGTTAWVDTTRGEAQEILDRMTRPKGRRFDRVSVMRYGYRVDEVDLVTDRISRYLAAGEPVTVEQVRSVAFRMQRGGYRETQVDAVLDAVVEVMLAVG